MINFIKIYFQILLDFFIFQSLRTLQEIEITAQRNNFNHSLKKCFHNFQFIGHEKESVKETKDKSIVDVLSDGIYLLTMFVLIVFLLPFFVYIYLNLFHEIKTLTEKIETYFPEYEPGEDLQNKQINL